MAHGLPPSIISIIATSHRDRYAFESIIMLSKATTCCPLTSFLHLPSHGDYTAQAHDKKPINSSAFSQFLASMVQSARKRLTTRPGEKPKSLTREAKPYNVTLKDHTGNSARISWYGSRNGSSLPYLSSWVFYMVNTDVL